VTCASWWFSRGTPLFSTNKTDLYDITEIWLKVLLNTITLATVFPNTLLFQYYDFKVHWLLVSIRTFNNHGSVQLFMSTLIVILTVIACCLFELKRIYPRFTMYCSILYLLPQEMFSPRVGDLRINKWIIVATILCLYQATTHIWCIR